MAKKRSGAGYSRSKTRGKREQGETSADAFKGYGLAIGLGLGLLAGMLLGNMTVGILVGAVLGVA